MMASSSPPLWGLPSSRQGGGGGGGGAENDSTYSTTLAQMTETVMAQLFPVATISAA